MNWNPEDYARNSAAQLGWARELMARLKLRGDEALLDVGCGDGKITAEFARAVPAGFVLGVDSSAAFIRYARRHYPPAEYPNLRFALMDARRLIYPRKFDLIFSNATLHWVDDHRAFLAGCAGLLVLRGLLVISCGGSGNASDVVAVMEQITGQPKWAPYFTGFTFPYYFYSPNDYAHWLAEAGFTALRLELVEKDMIHTGRAGLAAWMRTTWLPYTQRVPPEQREAFLDDCAARYLELHPLDAAGLCHVRMVRLEVEARLEKANTGAEEF